MATITSDILTTVSSKESEKQFPPAYFLSLTVENVRCFGPQQTLDLSNGKGRPAQWTIILGNNGVGKTTLLKSLVALVPTRTQFDKEKIVVARLFENSWAMAQWNPSRKGAAASSLSADFLIGVGLDDQQNGEQVKAFDVQRTRDGSSAVGATAKLEKLGGFVCFGYGASRRMGETALSEDAGGDPFASLFSDDAPLLNAEEWLLQADYAAYAADNVLAKKRAKERRDTIKEILIKLLPDVEDIKFVQLTEKQLKPGIEVKTPYGWVSIKDLSLGYKTLIAWMVDFASRLFNRYPDSPNPLAEPAVVLVDEIDLHLHPKWQRNLMSFLSGLFPNTQFIATAHSPLVVQAATDANIVLLKREGDHVVIDNDVKAIRGWRVDQILTSDLFGLESARPPEMDGLLAERTKILSKGRLTKKDKERLEEIEARIGSLPTGETPEEIEAMDVIRRAAERLKAQGY
ncbi:MAG: AAA family ATPase [Acidobacteriota bacterium]|nr:AAA family ATPase [Acidobacteriota bacterium]